LALAVLVAVIALSYSNSFHGPFVLDDLPSIVDNASIRSLRHIGQVLYPPNQGGRTVDGRPVVNLSLAINYAISGLEVWSYHAFNLLTHVLAGLALFGVVRRTLLLPYFHERYTESSTWLALAVALIWGVHPLQTESVTYTIQRAESMVGLFYLLVLYCVIRAETSPRGRPWFVAAVACCALGMATKEVMVTAPVVVLLYERVFLFGSFRKLLVQRSKLYLAMAATWLLLVVLILPLGGRGGSAGIGHGVTVWQYAATQLGAIVMYLRLTFWPQPLVFDYGKPLANGAAEIVPQALIIATLIAATLAALRWRPALGFLGAAFFIILSPSSSIVPIVTQTIAEHRMYLPLAPVLTLVVMLFDTLWDRFVRRLDPELRQRPLLRYAPAALVLAVSVLFGMQTWLRNLDYRSAITLWQDTVDDRPQNPRAYANLAEHLMLIGQFDEALEVCTRCIELNPNSDEGWYGRGTYHLQAGQYRKAIADLDHALELGGQEAEIHQNRGVAYRRLGEYEKAVQDFDRALALKPDLRVSYRNRALALAALGRLEEAQRDAQEFIERGGKQDPELQKILDGPQTAS
jgi:tetratricopeptide (TPR) repeat protein